MYCKVVRAYGSKDLRKSRVVPSVEELLHLKPSEASQVHPDYRQIIGKLLWISIISRPDIAFAVTFLARFNSCSGNEHYAEAVRVVDYLAATRLKKITYYRDGDDRLRKHLADNAPGAPQEACTSEATSFSDSSHGGERPMAGSTSIIARGPVQWHAFRLQTTPLSVCQGEYMAATKAAIAILALAETAAFMGFKFNTPCPVFCDNKAAVLLTESATSSKRLKHIATRIAFLRELVESKQIVLYHINGSAQLADLFTKPLRADVFHPLRSFFVE